MNNYKPFLEGAMDNPFNRELFFIVQELKRLERRISNIEKNLIQEQLSNKKVNDNMNNNYSLDNYII